MLSNCCQRVFISCPILFTLCQDLFNCRRNAVRKCCHRAQFMNHNRSLHGTIVTTSYPCTVSLEDQLCPKIIKKNKA
jgi:hypothetical protein